MFNNPHSLTSEEFFRQAQRPENRDYVVFGCEEVDRCGLNHTACRIYWSDVKVKVVAGSPLIGCLIREGMTIIFPNVPHLSIDFRWRHYDSPEWLTSESTQLNLF